MIKSLSFKKQAPDLATPQTIATLEATLNLRFPAPFVEFCTRWNGGFPAKTNEFYPVPREFGEFYKEYGTNAKGVCVSKMLGITDAFWQCSWLSEYNLMNEGSSWGLVPITVDLFGNHVVLRPDSLSGPVYWSDHELWEMPDTPEALGDVANQPQLIPIAPDLESFYNGLTSRIPIAKND
jgi:SMI1 / KNR4 family (SUKH-1)